MTPKELYSLYLDAINRPKEEAQALSNAVDSLLSEAESYLVDTTDKVVKERMEILNFFCEETSIEVQAGEIRKRLREKGFHTSLEVNNSSDSVSPSFYLEFN